MTLADVASPIDAGKRLRAEAMLRAVAQRCDVDLAVLFADADPVRRPLPDDISARWALVPHSVRSASAAGVSLVTRREPWESAVHDWGEVRRALDAFGDDHDLVWFGALHHFERLRAHVRAPRMIVDCDDVETEKIDNLLSLSGGPSSNLVTRLQRRIERPMWGRIQRRAVADADAVLVCSELDRNRLLAQAAAGDARARQRVVSIANTYPDPGRLTRRCPQGVLTLAVVANYGTDQNVDAADFAVREILPALRLKVPEARIRFIGRCPERLKQINGIDGVDIVGPVDSVRAELSNAHAVLVPIRYGGGTRLKVLEAMAYGVPVLATPVGAEGIDAVAGQHLLLAETGEQFAEIACRVLTQPDFVAEMTSAARSLYERKYRPDAASSNVNTLLDRVLQSRADTRRITD